MKPAVLSWIIVLALTGYFGYYNRFYLQNQQRLRMLGEQLVGEQQTQALRSELARSLEEVERFGKLLPQEPDTQWLVREVSKVAEETGIRLTSVTPQSPRQLQEVTQLAVALQVTTSYHQLGKFISALEGSALFIRVDDLDVSRGSDEQHPAEVRMTLSTFYVPPMNLQGG